MNARDILEQHNELIKVSDGIKIGKRNKAKLLDMSKIKKHHLDNLEYIAITLKNGLKIICVSDEQTNISCGHMYIGSGDTSNPPNLDGLAHFVEHMLFKGSKKYPDGAYFMDNVTKNGGDTNAFTAENQTEYYFTAKSDKFMEVLDIFSRFFIDPIFDVKFIITELNAVNSEHEKNIGNDMWRKQSLFKKFFIDGYYNRFSTGTKETLLENNDVYKLQQYVKMFYDDYYFAENMLLVVYHNKIDKKFVRKIMNIFRDVKSCNNKPKQYTAVTRELINEYEFVAMESITTFDILNISWVVEGNVAYINNLDTCPFPLITHVLGYIYKNSLREILINMHYISMFTATTGGIRLGKNTTIDLEMELTEKGYQHYDDILYIVNMCIQRIFKFYSDKKNFFDLYDELYHLWILYFEDYVKQSPTSIASKLIRAHTEYNLASRYCLLALLLMGDIDEMHKKFLMTLEKLTLNRMKVILCSQKNKNLNMIDEYYGTKYKCATETIKNSHIKVKFDLPKKNPFLPKQTNMLEFADAKSTYVKLQTKYPNIAYARAKNTYNIKSCSLYVTLIFEQYTKDIDMYIIMLLYFAYIRHKKRYKKYQLDMASYAISFSLGSGGYDCNMVFTGYTTPDTVSIFAKLADWYFKSNLEKEIDIDIYERIYNELYKGYTNMAYDMPYSQLPSEFSCNINKAKNICYRDIVAKLEAKFTSKHMMQENQAVNFKNFRQKAMEQLTHGYFKCIMGGSIDEQMCTDFVAYLEKTIKPKYNNNIPTSLPKFMNHKKDIIVTRNINIHNKDQGISYGIYIGRLDIGSAKQYASDAELMLMIYQQFLLTFCANSFHTNMRTDNETGYIATVGSQNDIYKLQNYIVDMFVCFVVQTTKSNIIFLIEEFLEQLCKDIDAMSDQEYETIVATLQNQFEYVFSTVDQELSYFHWSSILLRHYTENENEHFDIKQRLQACIKSADKADVKTQIKNIIKFGYRYIVHILPIE